MAIIRNITMANKDHLNLIITGHDPFRGIPGMSLLE